MDTKNDTNRAAVIAYAQFVLANEEAIKVQVQELGSLGKYVTSLLFHWAERMLKKLA